MNLYFLPIDKPATLSSVFVHSKKVYSFEAKFAVDGVYRPSGNLLSLAHSNKENRPWWRVDLGDVHCVWAVNILNRYDCKLGWLYTQLYKKTHTHTRTHTHIYVYII